MKKHFAASNPIGIIIGAVFCAFGTIAPLIIASALNSFNKAKASYYGNQGNGNESLFALIPVSLVGIFLIATGIYLMVKAIKGYNFYRTAMKGHKSYGTVKDSYYTGGKNSQYVLTVSYTAEDGEEMAFTCNPGPQYAGFCSIGKRIPVYLNGDCAYIDAEGIRNPAEDDSEEPKEAPKGKLCPYCGDATEEGSLFCRNCGSRL